MILDLTGTNGAVDLHFSRPGERDRWRAVYLRRLIATDAVVVAAAVFLAQLLTVGAGAGNPLAWDPNRTVADTALSVAIALSWSICLGWNDSRSHHATAVEEYRRLVTATVRLFGAIAIVAVLADIEPVRDYLALALPTGLLGLALTRALWRGHTARHRALGRYRRSVLVVGGTDAAAAVATTLARHPHYGYDVVGVCTATAAGDDPAAPATVTVAGREIPVAGDDRSVLRAARRTEADTVVVMATDRLGPRDIRRLAWDLDSLGVELIVAPGVMDISGTRMSAQLLGGMPMLHIERPQYDRALSLTKAVFDICFSALVVALISPVLLAIAIAVKCTSHGPVFYLSERIGMDGKPFQMIKFRSMYAHADRQAGSLISANGGNPLFFKLKNDPRVTPIGHFLRKYSLDELPQFFNVLRRDMSVVGPRPQVRREVHSYDGVMRRRLLVRPGITGLWQVSGRSDLAPEESVELDISYVENWSMALDLSIITRTLHTVAKGEGAY